MAETTSQILRYASLKQKNANTMLTRPFVGQIVSINYKTEKLSVVMPASQRDLDYSHPFVGKSSWIRCSPEVGMNPVIQYRGDRPQPTILKYQQEDNEIRIKRYNTKLSVYRPLRPGEMEIASSGMAQAYYASRGISESRGGIIRDWRNQDELELGQKAPLLIRQMMHNKIGGMDDEIREGIVKRYVQGQINKTYFPKVRNSYKKEIYISLLDFDNKRILFKREGHVINEDGSEELHSRTQKPLRVKNLYYTKEGNAYVSMELDEVGNFACKFPTSATEGGFFSIPKGGLEFSLGGEFRISSQKGFSALLKEDFSVKAGQAQIKLTKDGKVALGNSSNELLAIIEELLDTLTNSTYAGFGAPASTVAQYPVLKSKLQTIKGSL